MTNEFGFAPAFAQLGEAALSTKLWGRGWGGGSIALQLSSRNEAVCRVSTRCTAQLMHAPHPFQKQPSASCGSLPATWSSTFTCMLPFWKSLPGGHAVLDNAPLLVFLHFMALSLPTVSSLPRLPTFVIFHQMLPSLKKPAYLSCLCLVSASELPNTETYCPQCPSLSP